MDTEKHAITTASDTSVTDETLQAEHDAAASCDESSTAAHHHDPADMRAIVNRMNRAIGHLEATKRMVENDEDCSKVLIQLAAVKSAVNNIGKELLKEHLSHCIVDAVEDGDEHALEALNTAIDQFMK